MSQESGGPDQNEISAICLFSGKPPRYVEKTFDEVRSSTVSEFPPALEILVIPGTAAFAIVHAPIGAQAGYPVPLGLASFDTEIVDRVYTYVSERMDLISSA